ncbi:Glycoside hydrolase family 5 protein [Mycena venus]|uniref:Glycoside hydrolase family 5 protein n=1 Tax=Mycena venus TaxID=2733690 RepID=A0A8H6XD60_9AGAR|nr:Glycoside hydrolase family 5 protein [Mycena venus]
MLSCSITGTFWVMVLLHAVTAISNEPDKNSNPRDCKGLQDLPVEPFPPFDQPTATVMRYRKQQSVNLGSWFVHESWMTPSLFEEASGDKVSEIDIASGWNSTTCAREVLETHWETFMNYSDFSYLSRIGINTVRIPIGYWSLGPKYCQGTPFSPYADVYHNSWSFVVRAINMAGEAGIGVLVDLHAAVGSQNGQPHSGISDGHIGLFDNQTNIEKTLAVLTFLTQQLCNVTNVVGVQILNEPHNCRELIGFYDEAISIMRKVPGAEDFPFYIHDAFNLQEFSDYVASRTDFVVQDHHSYFVFTSEDAKKSASQHKEDIETWYSDLLAAAFANQRGNLVIDEWSCALTAESLSQEPDEDAARRAFCMAQLNTYSNTTAGWSFWGYMKEDCDTDPGWCFRSAIHDALPSDFSPYMSSCNPPKPFVAGLLDRELDVKSVSLVHHRPEAIHRRRGRREAGNMTAEEQSSDKGYRDGFSTAEDFCYCGSQLGFTGQYIQTSIEALGPGVIAPGTESYYRAGFTQGLADGEASSN